ncbi:ABC transporter substrate-binding protein [Salinibacterium sp. SYSU T00001]|uniref:ABC transporter substrate-binding protein n=1 Tax=Homoserinimonas sedimenticola TaxID=2986805 RepID=UPI002235E0B1|nr:ABC transporter substrate-binding protein [Salinibacterium sedimenticola]MCW4385272.1 ABC transporter substrate-binding protein [Salinibacterium sedimenticola]
MSVFAKANAGSRGRKALYAGVAGLGAVALVLSGCASTEDDGGNGGNTGEDLTLKIGTALPVTGNLAFLGPPEVAGVRYAADQINSADLGIQVEIVEGDSGDTDNKAYETEIPRLLGEDVSAIIGAASSGVSLQFIDQVVAADTILFSPANTSDAFTTYDDNDLYFRTAPSDVLQGEVLGNLIAEDGHETLGMIVLNDSYGTGLQKYVTEAFEAAGGEVVATSSYNTGDTSFDAQISEVLAADPDAIALITFEEVKTMLPSIVSAFPAENLYFVDGNLSNFGDQFPQGTLEGAKGTFPGTNVDDLAEFTTALNDFWVESGEEELNEYTYGAESYDAVMLLALAALKAGSTDAADISAALQEVSGGSGDGEKCTTFADCAEIINNGDVADYDGVSGPITFDEVGDPTEATIGTYIFGPDNTYTAY